MLSIYTYKNCDSCKKAIKFLKNHSIPFKEIAIRETPPSIEELRVALKHYDTNIKKLFNVSGQDYRQLDLKNKLPSLSDDEALSLLSKNGNLVKRPFVISNSVVLVGFKLDTWIHEFEINN